MKNRLVRTILCSALAPLFVGTNVLAQNLTWSVQPDFQMDSLPSPDGKFEIEGIATAQDKDFFYVAIFAPPELINGVQYKDTSVHIGDLFFNYADGSNQAIRLSPNSRSQLPYGTIVSDVNPFSVADLVYGQRSISEYTTRIGQLGIKPFNTYSENSLLTDSSVSSPSDISEYNSITFLDTSLKISVGMDNTLAIVKIPKAALKNTGGTLSVTLECGNDFLEIDIPMIELETSQKITVNTVDTVNTVNSTNLEELEDSNVLEYALGGTALGVIIFLLFSSSSNPVTEPIVEPIVEPVVEPVVEPPSITDIDEGSNTLALLSFFLLFLYRLKLNVRK